MEKVRIIFYITPWVAKLKYWVNWLISIRTLSKYSHVEFWTTDCNGSFKFDYMGFGTREDVTGECWAATMRGKVNGTVKRDASGVLKHPKNWHYIEVEADTAAYAMMIDYMQNEVDSNNGYSKWDILKFISPVHIPDKKRNICSEYVNNGLYMACIFGEGGIISPGKLHGKLTKLGYETKPLIEM